MFSLLFSRLIGRHAGGVTRRLRIAACAAVTLPLLTSCVSFDPPLEPAPDLLPDSPNRAAISKMYVFGDSISDTGNLFGLLDDITPVSRPRLESPPTRPGGRVVSNKYLSVEYIASHYGLNLAPAWKPMPDSRDVLLPLNIKARVNIAQKVLGFDTLSSNMSLQTDEHEAVMNIHMTHSGGNNYAVAKASVLSYPGLTFRFFNKFRLSKQVDLHAQQADALKMTSNALHFVLIGGNDIFNILENPSLHRHANDHIALLIDDMEAQIKKLRDMGAQKILVGTTPDIGQIPAFRNTVHRELASRLSHKLDRDMGARIRENFDPRHVHYVSIPSFLDQALRAWPSPSTDTNCTKRKFSLKHYLVTGGEIRTRFVNNCSQERLNAGDFVYFDNIHGTDALYQAIGRLYIQEIDEFMKIS